MAEKQISGILYKILACPVCKAKLRYSKNEKHLNCTVCKAEFSIKDNIPVMLVKKR